MLLLSLHSFSHITPRKEEWLTQEVTVLRIRHKWLIAFCITLSKSSYLQMTNITASKQDSYIYHESLQKTVMVQWILLILRWIIRKLVDWKSQLLTCSLYFRVRIRSPSSSSPESSSHQDQIEKNRGCF